MNVPEEIQKEYHVVIDSLIDLNKKYREAFSSKIEDLLSPGLYAMECCTVKVDIGRQTGKSSYIRQHAGPHDLVITFNEASAREIGRDLSSSVVCVRDLDVDVKYIKPLNKVYIDEPQAVFRIIPAVTIYNLLTMNNQKPTFILLG